MIRLKGRILLVILLIITSYSFSEPITGQLKIAAIRVQFSIDQNEGTTGDGLFLLGNDSIECAEYTIDPPPHNRNYFFSQLKAVNSYFQTVSYNNFGIDLENSFVYPEELNSSYSLPNPMSYYHPYGESDELHEERITQLFRDALDAAEEVPFQNYDLVVVFHAGIGQDFTLPTLDPTPEDIPSTYVDREMMGLPYLGIEHGIVLPETQNHLLFPETESIFSSASDPCQYQFGLTGTFALMVGFAIGLPPLWDTDSGDSGLGVFGLMDQGSNNGQGVIPSPPDAWTRTWAGWVDPLIMIPHSSVELASINLDPSIIQVPINDHEYFLIENRNNWYKEHVNIDSTRYAIWRETGEYPGFYKVLFDSVDYEIDETNVITSIPNYDLGLPTSGLLIWHINESVIESTPDWYSINADRERRGIDLEEADGAQDIGYPSIHMFFDPSSGYFGDMWFKGNEQYEEINGHRYPVFGPYTYPNTQANDGSSTYLKIENISLPDDTMSFDISNTLLFEELPESTDKIRFVIDINNDGIKDIIGGIDSLWWASINELDSRKYFMNGSEPFTYSGGLFFTLKSSSLHRLSISTLDDPYIYDFTFDQETENMILSQVIGPLSEPVKLVLNEETGNVDSLAFPQYDLYRKELTLKWRAEVNIHEGIVVNYTDQTQSIIDDKQFLSIAACDLNLDGKPELLTVDSNNNLYAYDKNLILMPGFPMTDSLDELVFVNNLIGDEHPEIVVKSHDGQKLYVINYDGEIRYQISTYSNETIQHIGKLDQYSYIVTTQRIWKFESGDSFTGNEWAYINGDASHTRSFDSTEAWVSVEVDLMDTDRTYAYPNPVYEENVTLRVQCESAKSIEIRMYDLAGYYIETLKITDTKTMMPNEIIWNVKDVESGVYFAHVTASKDGKTQSTVLKIAVIH